VNPHKSSDDRSDETTTGDLVSLERELRRSLAPVDPPNGFADQIIARSRQEPSRASRLPRLVSASALRRIPVWVGCAVATTLFAAVLAGVRIRDLQQQRKAEEARMQFETALQITDRALDHARQHLQRAGISLEQ